MEELFILNSKFLLWTEIPICQQEQFYLLSICKNRLTEVILIIKSMFSSYMLRTNLASFVNFNKKVHSVPAVFSFYKGI